MKAHKRDIAAAWAKDWKPHGWERIVEANDPVAVNKSRERAIRDHNRRKQNENRNRFKR